MCSYLNTHVTLLAFSFLVFVFPFKLPTSAVVIMFPTSHHARLVFQTFDIHQRGYLTPTELEHALNAVGLADAAKQIVYGIIRQARSDSAAVQTPTSTTEPTPQLSPTPSLYSIHGSGMMTASSSNVHSTPRHHSAAQLSTLGAASFPIASAGVRGGGLMDDTTHSLSAPIVTVSFDEFLLVVRELSPAPGSSEEMWKGFKCLDTAQRGRVTLETLVGVVRRDEEKLVGKIIAQTRAPSPHAASDHHLNGSSDSSRPLLGVRSCVRAVETSLRCLVEHAAEYREKGVAFDEWKSAVAVS